MAEISLMGIDPNDQWRAIEIEASLVGRKAGASASDKARELGAEQPVATLVSRLLRRRTDEWAWRRGATGERVTALWLRRLPAGWHVFHDIPVGQRGANIDHIVIGPGGVLTVNTKNLSASVTVYSRGIESNGYRTNFLAKSAGEAERAARLLGAAVGHDVTVRAALAIIADEWHVKEAPSAIFVGSPRDLRHWIRSLPRSLSAHEVIELCAAAAKPATWTKGGISGR